jgi:hypothetical protein
VENECQEVRQELHDKVTNVQLQTEIFVESMLEAGKIEEAKKRQQHVVIQLRKIIFKMQRESLARAFATWCVKVKAQQQAQETVRKVIARIKNRFIATAFETWATNVAYFVKRQQVIAVGLRRPFLMTSL